jgi:hypothetical protein
MKQQLQGGLADKIPSSSFSKDQLEKGIKVEMEHTNDPAKAKEIAMDHLAENPKYYDHLEKMEREMDKQSGLAKGIMEGLLGVGELTAESLARRGTRGVRRMTAPAAAGGGGAYAIQKTTGKEKGSEKKASFWEAFGKQAGSKREDKPLYQPKPSTRPGKKKMVYVKGPGGRPKLIHYGATGYRHNYSEEAKKSFRARHGCDKPGLSKDTARYWACEDLWPKSASVHFWDGFKR